MNKANGVTEVQYNALLYAITHLRGYKVGESSMRKYYFPVRSLSEAINNTDNIKTDEFEEENGLSF